jgi:tripartite-type tricarboxylate transporter receptor subunit TctC
MTRHHASRTTRRHALGTVLAIAALTLAGQASAQTYPAKPITFIVPFAAGSATDQLARAVGSSITQETKQAVIVDNKAGASGMMAAQAAAKAPADGYTVLMALSSYSVIPEADTLLGRAPLYSFSALRPIARITADPTVLAVRADAPWKSAKDFVEDARKRPGAINYGSSGNYGTMHVPMEILAQNAGIKLTHVPFTGAAPAVVALLGGQIDAVSTGPATVVQHVKAGKIRVLAHWGNGKLQALPDVPSLKEAGYNAEYAQWSGMFIPAATPEPVAQRLRAAVRAAANDPKVKDVIGNAGSPILYQDTPDFEKYVQADVKRMADVVKKIGKVE